MIGAAAERPSVNPPGDVGPAVSRRRLTVFAVAAVIAFVIDQITKVIVRRQIAPGERIDVLPGVDFIRARNEGIAFGLFPGRPGLVAAITLVVLVGITVALVRLSRQSMIAALGGGSLIGGSIGNLVDRIVHDGVTDFIDLPNWHAFNVADIAIVGGAMAIGLSLLLVRDGP
jgi:signal peptidase II